jgi:hypothetical protein
MVSLRIRVFKGGESSPETTVSIPVAMLRFASWLLPRQTAGALREKGIELEEIIRLADNPEARGTLIEVQEHRKDQRIVIALE